MPEYHVEVRNTLTFDEEERPPDAPRSNPVELPKPVKCWVVLFFAIELLGISLLLIVFSTNGNSNSSGGMRRSRLIIVSILMGLFAIGVAAFYIVRRKNLSGHGQNLYNSGKSSLATVTEIELDEHKDYYFSKYAWVVRWKFTAHNGTEYEGVSALQNIPTALVGDTFWILYDNDNPSVNIRWKVFEDLDKFYEHIALGREIIPYLPNPSVEDPRSTITSM